MFWEVADVGATGGAQGGGRICTYLVIIEGYSELPGYYNFPSFSLFVSFRFSAVG